MTATEPAPTASIAPAAGPWLPMAVIMLAQIQMSFNVTALPVSIGSIVEDFGTPATTIGTALVVYSLCVAAFVMLGAKFGKVIGERLIFQLTVLIHGAAMLLMALSVSTGVMIGAQAIAGLAAACLVPSLVVLVAANYRGRQQAQCLGLLAGTPAIASVLAFVIAGFLGTALTWRYSFAFLTVLSALVLLLSFRLNPVERQAGIKIDVIGAALAAAAIILISLGFNYLNEWGPLLARGPAPFSIAGFSPAPLLILVGLVLAQTFFAWAHKRRAANDPALLSLEVLDTPTERNAAFAMLVVGILGAAVNFLLPLYMQIVQGRSSLATSVAAVPYTLAIFMAAVLVVRLYESQTARQIGAVSFAVMAVGLVLLAFTIGGDWGTPLVIVGLVVVGLGEGALLTLLFNVLVSESPKRLAGDVGALRGTANNLATAVGTAVAGLASVGLLALFVASSLASNSTLPRELQAQVNLDKVSFVSNDHLTETLDNNTSASPEQVTEAVRLNTLTRQRALRGTFLILAGIALLAIVPSLRLPKYSPGEVPASAATDGSQAPPQPAVAAA
jgi:MFS family permease